MCTKKHRRIACLHHACNSITFARYLIAARHAHRFTRWHEAHHLDEHGVVVPSRLYETGARPSRTQTRTDHASMAQAWHLYWVQARQNNSPMPAQMRYCSCHLSGACAHACRVSDSTCTQSVLFTSMARIAACTCVLLRRTDQLSMPRRGGADR
jgi:hypothetical protein